MFFPWFVFYVEAFITLDWESKYLIKASNQIISTRCVCDEYYIWPLEFVVLDYGGSVFFLF